MSTFMGGKMDLVIIAGSYSMWPLLVCMDEMDAGVGNRGCNDGSGCVFLIEGMSTVVFVVEVIRLAKHCCGSVTIHCDSGRRAVTGLRWCFRSLLECLLQCFFRLLLAVNVVPHSSQRNGFSPVCVRLCLLSVPI